MKKDGTQKPSGGRMLRMNRPQGVTVIAVLYFVGAAFFGLLGLAFLLGGGMMAAAIARETGISAAVIGGLGIVGFIAMLCLAGIDVLIGWGLLSLKEWARIVAIVFAALSAIGGFFSLFRFSFFGLIRLAISGWMIWYLLQPQVVAAFRGLPAATVPPAVPPPVPRT
jgi:hypothetical protein